MYDETVLPEFDATMHKSEFIHKTKRSSIRNNEINKTNVSMLTVIRKEFCEKPGKFRFVGFTQLHENLSLHSFSHLYHSFSCSVSFAKGINLSSVTLELGTHPSTKLTLDKKAFEKVKMVEGKKKIFNRGWRNATGKVGFLMRSEFILLLFSKRIISSLHLRNSREDFIKKQRSRALNIFLFYRFQFF